MRGNITDKGLRLICSLSLASKLEVLFPISNSLVLLQRDLTFTGLSDSKRLDGGGKGVANN